MLRYLGQIDASDSKQKLFIELYHSSKLSDNFGIVVTDIHGKKYNTDFVFDDIFFILDSDIIEQHLVT